MSDYLSLTNTGHTTGNKLHEDKIVNVIVSLWETNKYVDILQF